MNNLERVKWIQFFEGNIVALNKAKTQVINESNVKNLKTISKTCIDLGRKFSGKADARVFFLYIERKIAKTQNPIILKRFILGVIEKIENEMVRRLKELRKAE